MKVSPPACPLSKSTLAYKDIRLCVPELLQGRVLSVDPSSGSESSMPGYALFEAGVCKEHGIIELERKGEQPKYRLCELGKSLRTEFETPDVLVIEKISAKSWDRRRGAAGHASLLKSVGTILGAHDWPYIVEIPPSQWKKISVDADYEKGDAEDALYMGKAAIMVADWLYHHGKRIRKERT